MSSIYLPAVENWKGAWVWDGQSTAPPSGLESFVLDATVVWIGGLLGGNVDKSNTFPGGITLEFPDSQRGGNARGLVYAFPSSTDRLVVRYERAVDGVLEVVGTVSLVRSQISEF